MTPVQASPVDLFFTHVGGTFKDDPAAVELVREIRYAHKMDRLLPWVTVAWSDVCRPSVFFTADRASTTALAVVLAGEGCWSDMWSTDLGPLAEDVGARIENGRVVG